MADGQLGAGDLFRSRILGMGLEDTPYPQQQIGGMMSGMQPEQLAAFFQSPEVQKQFQSFGIDPQAMLAHTRQSPFFPNQFMQQHPLLGGFLNRSMANIAATPEAPLVSGAGSGMTRAMQGAYGGPEMLRHYQLQQMMAPMGALGAMMPTFGEQRRRAIEQAIVDREQASQKYLPQEQDIRDRQAQARQDLAAAQEARARTAEEALNRPQVHFGPIGTGIETIQHEPYQPVGGPQGVNLLQTGQGHPMMPVSGPLAGQQQQLPGYALTPEQQEGWSKEYTPYDQAAMQGQFAAKAAGGQTPEKGALLTAQTHEAEGKAEQARATAAQKRYQSTPQYKIATELGKSDQYFNVARQKIDDKYNPLITSVGEDSKEGQKLEQQRQNELSAAVANYLVRIQHSGGQITSEQQNWLQQYQQGAGALPPQVAPRGANKPTSTKSTQQGPPTSPTTATAPNATGLPPGYHFNEQGIPVPDQQAAPQQAPRP